jgi:hypothetical protein
MQSRSFASLHFRNANHRWPDVLADAVFPDFSWRPSGIQMLSSRLVPETATIQRMITLFRILCDMTDRAEVLHFMTAVNARAIMVRPLWVAFEMVGSPQEIEGVYQSALAYGIVDVVSSSCALMTAANESDGIASAVRRGAGGCAGITCRAVGISASAANAILIRACVLKSA